MSRVLSVILLVSLLAPACGVGGVLRSEPRQAPDRAGRFDQFLAELHLVLRDASPELATRLGSAKDAGYWDGRDIPSSERQFGLLARALTRLEDEFPAQELDPVRRRDRDLVERDLRSRQERLRLETALPSVHPWRGLPVLAPSILEREQPRGGDEAVSAWRRRLERLPSHIEAEVAGLESRDYVGVGLPRALLDQLVTQLAALEKRLVEGDRGLDAEPFLGPFIEQLGSAPEASAKRLATDTRAILRDDLQPAYARLIAALEDRRAQAPESSGVWRDAVTESAWLSTLAGLAGPELSPDTLHAMGRADVARLHVQLAEWLDPNVPERRSLRAFFDAVRADPTQAPGGAASPRAPEALWLSVRSNLGRVLDAPSAVPLESVRARPWERPRGRWTPYVPPGLDLSRPARYLRPAAEDATVPPWAREVEALRFGLPGRALYDALTLTAPNRPLVLRSTERPAHSGGWGLYAVQLCAELELVDEPDGGFGRLAQELLAAAALIVDTGLHHRRWTRMQALDFLLEATPWPDPACRDLVSRCAAEPGLAIAPAIGLNRLRDLRERAESELGPEFDLLEFHAVLLGNGPLPLDVLESVVADWIAVRTGSS